MFGMEILEVIIGLVFFYLFLSVICSALSEWISSIFSWRAANLNLAVKNLLNDRAGHTLAASLLNHPLVQGLKSPGGRLTVVTKENPDYIPPDLFVMALLDVVSGGKGGTRSVMRLREAVTALESEYARKTLQPLIDHAGENIDAVRENLERWFDDAMGRAGGWYKRKIQIVITALAVGVTVVLNADTLMIGKALWHDDTLRLSVVAAAEQAAKENPSARAMSLTEVRAQLEKTPLPLGWSADEGDLRAAPSNASGWVLKLTGWFMTVMAVSLGAPFWFDALNKLISLRATGRRPGAVAEKEKK